MEKLFFVLFLFFVSSCSNVSQIKEDKELNSIIKPMNSEDPFENYNRAVYSFNESFNYLIGEPIANTYNKLPHPFKKGVGNFFQNLAEPLNIINSLLQGEVETALGSFMRFTINSTFGLLGLLDIADEAGLKYQKEDLGQTLYTWGLWEESSFFMVPFIGPYTTRELLGSSIDSSYNPTYPYVIETDEKGRALMFVGSKFIDYTKVVNLSAEMRRQPDPYIFMRESYLQYRTNLIYNGNPPEVEMDDFDFE